MYAKLKILHHSHSGRLRPHEHTSYLPLALLVFLTGAVLLWFSFVSTTQAASPGPQAGSIGLTGVMPAKPPTTAATIDTPVNGQHFKISPITVAGKCPNGTLVEVFKDKIFAGATNCSNGQYSLKVDLLFGKNVLIAQVFDSLNQAGPFSNSVTVYYDTPLPPTLPTSFLDFTGAQLLLDTDAVYRGSFPGQTLNVPITIIGGTAPYAVTVDWGDGTTKVIPRGNNSVFNASHAYKKAGTYTITLQATDSKGLTAYIQVVAIINGQPAGVASTAPPASDHLIALLWPIFAIAATMVISFWFGERHEKKILTKHNPPPLLPLSTAPPAHP